MADRLHHGHHRFLDHHPADERAFLQQLTGKQQRPAAIYIGCSDSHMLPELLTGSAPGDLFVVRNVANLVPRPDHRDTSVGAAIEYAVSHLHVPHIIVCGHDGCGGLRGAIQGLEHLADCPSLVEWLQEALPAVERAREACGPNVDSDTLWRTAVEENVLEQLDHLVPFPAVAAAIEEDRVELHGWVYDLHTLELRVYDPERGRFRRVSEVLND